MRDNLNRDELIIKISKSKYNILSPAELNELSTKELNELYKSIVEQEIQNASEVTSEDKGTGFGGKPVTVKDAFLNSVKKNHYRFVPEDELDDCFKL